MLDINTLIGIALAVWVWTVGLSVYALLRGRKRP